MRSKQRTSWADLAFDNIHAAKKLYAERHFRSSISRAYYAVYSCIVHRLPKGIKFSTGRNNPSHDQVYQLINTFAGLSFGKRKTLKSEIRFLRDCRETADYRPWRSVDSKLTFNCLKIADSICTYLEDIK